MSQAAIINTRVRKNGETPCLEVEPSFRAIILSVEYSARGENKRL
jgi:hypothetical protein